MTPGLLGNGKGQIGIVENHRGRLSTELESHALEITLCGKFLDLAAGGGAAGEGDLSNPCVRCQERPGLSPSIDDIDGSWGEAFPDQVAQRQGSEWRFFRRLVDNGISSRKSRLNSGTESWSARRI